MDSHPQPTTSILEIQPPPPGIFGTRIPSTLAFAVAVLLFFLPFAEIKCNNTSLMQNSGIGIAMGKEWKLSENSPFNELRGSSPSSQNGTTRKDPNAYAIAALALGLLGLALAIPDARSASMIALVSGVLAAGALIGLWIDLRNQMNLSKDGFNKTGGMTSDASSLSITLQPTAWFFISIIAFLAAAYFSYRRIQLTRLK
jgi:hypothetical protein